MPYANQLGNKYNKRQEKVDIHDKRIAEFTDEDINKLLKVSDNLDIEVTETSIPLPTDIIPRADGEAATGVSETWAHGDHVHPTDTSRAPIESPAFTGNPTAPTSTTASSISTKGYVDTIIEQHGRGVTTATATLDTSSTSIQIPYDGVYISTTIKEANTQEEVICDVIYGPEFITVTVAEPPENPLNVTVLYIIVNN